MQIFTNKIANRSRITPIIILSIVFSFLSIGCTPKQQEQKLPAVNLNKLNWGLEAQIALQRAEEIYKQAVATGQDLSKGPCLSNALHGNPDYPETMWVLDIAHNPRQEVDNQSENQCQSFREGKAENFIELDTNGQVIKVYSPFLEQR
jgi:hypothetical protein